MPKLAIATWLRKFEPVKPFSPPDQERAYLADCARRFANQRRIISMVGAIVWLAFTYWDIDTLSEMGGSTRRYQLIVGIRLFGFIYLLLLFFASRKWSRSDETVWCALYAVSNFIVFSLSYWMMRLMPSEYGHAYYGLALLIVMTFGFATLRLSTRSVSLLMLASTMAPVVYMRLEMYFSTGIDLASEWRYVWKLSNVLCAAGVLGVGLGYQLERSQRATFWRERQLTLSSIAYQRQSQQLELVNQAMQASNRQSEEKALALIELKERMRQEAERKTWDMSQFLAGAVHDLRQPVQAIGNALDPAGRALAAGDMPSVNSMIALAHSATKLMAAQLGAMLEISRLQSGAVSATIQDLDLTSVIRTVLAQLETTAAQNGVTLDFAVPNARILVESDRLFLGRIVQNLIGNAIKYHDPSKGAECKVQVVILILPACVRLTIEDNGIGIAGEHLRNGAVFKPFYQVGNRLRQSDKGVGLGLSIVSALLLLLPEHRIEISSSLGKGTMVTIDVPHGSRLEADNVEEREGPEHALAARLSGLYLVLVEDDEMVCAATSALLASHGAIHEIAASYEALEELLPTLERVPDLLLTDFRLPNNRTALDVSRLLANGDQVPLIVFTGDALPASTLAALSPNPVLYKPVPAEDLIKAVHVAVTRSRQLETAP